MKMHLPYKNVLPGLTVESDQNLLPGLTVERENALTVKMHDLHVDSKVITCTTHPQTHTGLSTSTIIVDTTFVRCRSQLVKQLVAAAITMINPLHEVWLQLAYVITQDY